MRAELPLTDRFSQPCRQLVSIGEAGITPAGISTQPRRSRERRLTLVLSAAHIADSVRQLVQVDTQRWRGDLPSLGTSSTRCSHAYSMSHRQQGRWSAPDVVGRLDDAAALGGDQAEHDQLALGDEAQRLEPAGAGVVVFEEEPVDPQLVEQRLGDEVVAALRRPGGPEVAAAHVGGDGHALRPARQRGVDLADVAQVQVLGVVAALGHQPALLGVGAAEVAPELLHVEVHARVDRGGTAAVVHHARRGNGELRGRTRLVGQRLQRLEVIREDGPLEPHLVVDLQGGGGELQLPVPVEELHLQVLVFGAADAPELVDEVHVPGGSAELAVGGRLEPDIALHLDDRGDGAVLDRPQLLGGDAPGGEVVTGPQQLRWAQQAADVICPKRRCRASRHGHPPRLGPPSGERSLTLAILSLHISSQPPSTGRFTPVTEGFASRKATAPTTSRIDTSRPSGVRERKPSSTASGLVRQYGLSPTIDGWMALTRIGASSTARVWTIVVMPPLTVETVVEPGYGRSLASPPNSTIELDSPIRSSSAWMTSV